MMTINVFGPLQVLSDGQPLGKLPNKAKALLAFLAMQKDGASRSRLADLLWPYQRSEQARHSLRNCLLELRKALGPAVVHLVTDFAHCRLSGADTDWERLEQLARSPQTDDLAAAAELYRGEVVEGLNIQSEPFEEWLAFERERALLRVREVLGQLVIRPIDGDFCAAIAAGRRLVHLDPMCEAGQRGLMRAYASAGHRGAAQRQYVSCAQILKRELGVAPDRETKELAAQIITGTMPASPPVELPDPPKQPVPALCGRLDWLEKQIRRALAGERTLSRALATAAADGLAGALTALGGGVEQESRRAMDYPGSAVRTALTTTGMVTV